MAVNGGAAAPRSVTILGSTGSIGCNTLDLIARNRSDYRVEALTANTNVELLARQAVEFDASCAVVADETRYGELKEALSGTSVEAAAGEDALVEAALRPADWVMAAIVGAAGLRPTLSAIQRGVVVALANKECLVCAGDLVMDSVTKSGATLLPVDSEHNAIFQVFDFKQKSAVEKIILTASGGPFREYSLEQMAQVTPAQAVAHPNWDMGAKISVDSATMMNKGLEVIEAHHIFRVPEDQIDVLVHPQSVIHSMVAYVDGSVLAQLGTPDMRTPIAYTLAWPARIETPSERLNLGQISSLHFESPDPQKFPALRLAREALRAGGSKPTVLNAANEVAVAAFLSEQIGFLEIAAVVEETMDAVNDGPLRTIEDVFHLDEVARRQATSCLSTRR